MYVFFDLIDYSIYSIEIISLLWSEEFAHLVDSSESMWNCIFHLLWQLSIGQVVAFRLEDWIPTEVSTASWLDDSSWRSADKKTGLLLFRSFVGDNAHRISSFIRERLNHLGKSLRSNIFHKPLDIWPRQSFISIEAKRSIFYKHWLFDLLIGNISFLNCNLLRITLQLRNCIILNLRSTFSFWKSNSLPRIWLNSSNFFFYLSYILHCRWWDRDFSSP